MPLSGYQAEVARLLSKNRSEESHLAGGAALHAAVDSIRFSAAIDYFHDSEKSVAQAFAADKKLLETNGHACSIEMNQLGYIRCLVSKNSETTKIEWAFDSAWRFMPIQKNKDIGFVLHPIDLAVNKVLALVGRDEARDFLDVLYAHEKLLPLGALCWAACGKDPGFNPHSILELLKRRGRYHPEDFSRLNLNISIDLVDLKEKWLKALEAAEKFITHAPPEHLGTLFYSKAKGNFVEPKVPIDRSDIEICEGKLGGVLPFVK